MQGEPVIVVTGAAGFLGRALVPALMRRGYRVRGLVRSLDAATAARAQFLPVGDLALVPARTLANALRGASVVVHLAARVHQMRDAPAQAQAEYRLQNVTVTERLAHAAADAGVAHFVLASTVKVNGESTPLRPFVESDPPAPSDAYAESKWAAEQVLAAVAEETRMRATALRLPLTYGPGAKGNFAALVNAIRRRALLPLPNVANRRSVLGIGNFCDALGAVVASEDPDGGGRLLPYFLADAHAVSSLGLVRAIANALKVVPRVIGVSPGVMLAAGACAGRGAAAARLVESLEVDASLFGARFGWQPPFTLEQGIADAVATRAPL